MESVVIGEAAERSVPGLREALVAAGLGVRVGEPGAENAVRGYSRTVALHPGTASSLRFSGRDCDIVLAPADVAFGGALIAELLRPPRAPVASDPASRRLFAAAEKAAAHDVGILIEGPTGSGKEIVARFVHSRSPNRDGEFVAINCAALPETMLEALLFGHERGAFTGAGQGSKGLFRAAHGGTLFLDEIADMPLGLQGKLLRALQEREVLAIGATAPVRVDTRVVAATNRALNEEMAAGRFRNDLYYRLCVFPLRALPLSERPGDLLPLVAALLLKHSTAWGKFAWPTADALTQLAGRAWPGNVRELENVLQRALVLGENDVIDTPDLQFDTPRAAPAALSGQGEPKLGEIVRQREYEVIEAALAACGGRRADTAARLGVSERTLRYKLAEMAQARSGPPATMVMQ